MSMMRLGAGLTAFLLTMPAIGLAATGKPEAATHSTTGVVKSIDAAKLVITRPAAATKNKDMVFVMNPSTAREGTLSVGSMVEVRYRNEARQRVATAVTLHQHQGASASKPMRLVPDAECLRALGPQPQGTPRTRK
jgi:hypothetical protein